MTALIVLGTFLLWWMLGGLYARRVAVARNLQEQPSAVSALLRGPLWVREMLIWSTLPPRSFNPATQAETGDERTRSSATQEANAIGIPAAGAVSAIQYDPQASQLSSQWKPPTQQDDNAVIDMPVSEETRGSDISSPALPQSIPAPGIEPIADAPIAPATPAAGNADIPAVPVAPAADAIVAPPKKLPKQPKKKGQVKVLCPSCNKKRKYRSDAICPECHQANPWLVGAWGVSQQQDSVVETEIAAPPVVIGAVDSPLGPVPVMEQAALPDPEAFVETAKILLPEDAAKPKRLPGKPVFGSTVKTLCPWCKEQRAYHKDAVCPDCHNQNPWLAEKWKIKQSVEDVATHTEEPQPQALLPAVEKEATADLLAAPALPDTIPGSAEAPKIHEIPPVEEVAAEPAADPEVPHIHEIPEPVQPHAAPGAAAAAATPDHCPGCNRAAIADLYGKCMFCGGQLQEVLS